MEKIKKAREAIDLLKSLGLPVSSEQLKAVQDLEKEYLREEIIPLIQGEMESLVGNLESSFRIEIKYSKADGLEMNLVDRFTIKDNSILTSESNKRQKKYIIRVLFPDNHVSCNKMVWETLVDVVKYAGAERVRQLGITIMGDNLISPELNPNERYRVGQKEVEPGLYVCTYSSTETKYEQIRTINRELNLNLKIEKVLLDSGYSY
jgi:hypothetical protein